MRNAPVEADHPARWVGGHRYTNRIPWFRGHEGAPMEVESQALVSAVEKEISQSSLAVTIDVHSGFGFQDRLWFPYAKTVQPFPDLPMAYSLKDLLDRTYPHHFYRVEPQAQSYTTHGDLWDYIYDHHRELHGQQRYLPLCLEMGSWLWVKKNPWQIFRAEGPFNPLKGHRHQRTLRRHNTLMEFLIRAVASPQAWASMPADAMATCDKKAKELWYATPRNWIFLRGLARGVGHWGSFLELFKAQYPQDQVELIDLPGNGLRYQRKSPTQISDYVRDLRSRSELVQKGAPFYIFSVSLGSMIAVEWMHEFPHEVKKAYLTCTSASGFSSPLQRFLPINFIKGFSLLSAGQDEVAWEKTILNMVANSKERRDEEMLAMVTFTKNNPVHIQNILRQLYAASQYRFPQQAPGDVQLLGSFGDQLVSSQCTLKIAERWNLKPVMHPGQGMILPLTIRVGWSSSCSKKPVIWHFLRGKVFHSE